MWRPRPEPVLQRGQPGEWDSADALNPSVVRWGGRWLNLYSGYDGHTWHTGAATSGDGIAWTKLGRVLSPAPGTWEGAYIAANGSALAEGTRLLYWYQAGDPPRIGLAETTDGKRWRKRPEPVVGVGPRGSWDERGVADPYVIRAGGSYYMYFLGQDRARRQRLGVARSGDGIHWEKFRGNPILELGDFGAFDENGLGEPAVWTQHGRYWMIYTGRDRGEVRRMGFAASADGVRWSRAQEGPVIAGESAWNAKVVCDASVDHDGNRVRVWFGGGDVAHPAENIHGQIGYGEIEMEAVR